MNYQSIKLLGNAIVQVDFDSKETECKKCNKKIRFGITSLGKYIPIIKLDSGEYQAHFADCEYAKDLRITNNTRIKIMEEDRNQDLLNSL